MKKQYFLAQLEKSFPWAEMEKEVVPAVFNDLFLFKHELFWQQLRNVLDKHKNENPLRCAEIVDFVGRCANNCQRSVTLGHYKSNLLSELLLQYFEEAANQKLPFSTLQCIMVLYVSFWAYKQEIRDTCVRIWKQIEAETVCVKDVETEAQYARYYQFLMAKNGHFEKLLKKLGVFN